MYLGKFPIKLELGSGKNPQPGYTHLDISSEMPHVEIVHDISRPLPLPACSVSEILANHCIEHISWRNIGTLIKECYRILVPQGKIFLRTPDLEFIVKSYLNHEITPEYPPDELFIRENFGSITPSWWAILKLFSGQDYPSNFHFCCYDFITLQDIFLKTGFSTVKRVSVSPIFSPGEIQLEAYK